MIRRDFLTLLGARRCRGRWWWVRLWTGRLGIQARRDNSTNGKGKHFAEP
jgi:hypothetical protein